MPTYPAAIADLLKPPRLAALGPGQPNQDAYPRLKALTIQSAFGLDAVNDQNMAECCLAGLWLYHDFLDEAHTVCQDIDTPEGSYWHALMHRREPDYANAKYWFRRVGRHPVFLGLAADWDPFAFVDRCQASSGAGSEEEMLCRKIQAREWELLFDHCFRHVMGTR